MPTSLPKVTSLAESTSPPTELTALKPKVLRSPLSAMLIPTKGPTAMQSPLRLLSTLHLLTALLSTLHLLTAMLLYLNLLSTLQLLTSASLRCACLLPSSVHS